MLRPAFGLCLASLLLPLAAQEPARPARPLFSTNAGPTAPGTLELEAGLQSMDHHDGRNSRSMPTQLNLGLTSWLDVRFGWSGHNVNRTADGHQDQGFGDPLVGGQALLAPQSLAGLDIGLAYWHKVPRGSVQRGISSGAHDDQGALVLSRGRGPWMMDLNLGANWIGRSDQPGRVRQPFAAVALTWAFSPGWNATLEAYTLAGTEAGPRVASSILALSRDLNPALTLDVALERTLTQGAHRLALNAGLVWRMGHLWRQ